MEITEVKIRRMNDQKAEHVRAFISVTFDDVFVVHDIKLIEGQNGLFLAMPSRKVGETYQDIAHPIKSETRAKIRDAVFREYEKVLQEE